MAEIVAAFNAHLAKKSLTDRSGLANDNLSAAANRSLKMEAVTEFLPDRPQPFMDALMIITNAGQGALDGIPTSREHLELVDVTLKCLIRLRKSQRSIPGAANLSLSEKWQIFDAFVRPIDASFENLSRFAQLAVEAFDLVSTKVASPSPTTRYVERLRPLLESMSRAGEACAWITALRLMDLQPNSFKIATLVVSALKAEKLDELDALVRAHPGLKERAIKVVDFCIGRMILKKKNMAAQHGCQKLAVGTSFADKLPPFQTKVRKLLERWCRDFDEPESNCPNLAKARVKLQFAYLIWSGLKEGTMSPEAFVELVNKTMNGDLGCERVYIEELLRLQLPWLAEEVCVNFGLPLSSFTFPKKALRGSRQETPAGNGCVSPRQFYSKRILLESNGIKWIDDALSVSHVLDGLQKEARVALDCEWAPFVRGAEGRLALLQIATASTVFLFDMVALKSSFGEGETAGRSFEALLTSSGALKLGYDINHDLRLLRNRRPSLPVRGGMPPCNFMFDFHVLVKNFDAFDVPVPLDCVSGGQQRTYVDILFRADSAQTPRGGLSGLVEHLLGMPLNKNEQVSDWERRPLREAQKLYAAHDAYCLLDICTEFERRMKQGGCADVNRFWAALIQRQQEIVSGGCNPQTRASISSHPPPATQTIQFVPHLPVAFPSATLIPALPRIHGIMDVPLLSPVPWPGKPAAGTPLKFVVGTMLLGCGMRLKGLGLDVEVPHHARPNVSLLSFCREEGRILLVIGGRRGKKLRRKAPEGKCYLLQPQTGCKGHIQDIVSAFKITVSPDAIEEVCAKRRFRL